MSKGIVPLPTNINDFSPKILGLESNKAILLVLMVSLSAIILRYSIYLAVIAALLGLFFSIPLGGEVSIAAYAERALLWRLSALGVKRNFGPFVEVIDDFPFIKQGNRIGTVLEVQGGGYHSLGNSRKNRLQYSLSSALSTLGLNASVISIPFHFSMEQEFTAKKGKTGENYAAYLNFLFRDQYYYRSFLVIWSKVIGDKSTSVRKLLDETRSLQFSLRNALTKCRILSEYGEVSTFLGYLE